MVTVLILNFLTIYPHMPIDPTCIVGCLYYVCDSAIVEDCRNHRGRRFAEADNAGGTNAKIYLWHNGRRLRSRTTRDILRG